MREMPSFRLPTTVDPSDANAVADIVEVWARELVTTYDNERDRVNACAEEEEQNAIRFEAWQIQQAARDER